MSGVQEQFEIKFWLPDGTDIGPRRFPQGHAVAPCRYSRGRPSHLIFYNLVFF
jgi:hypothetical protein